jgi:hypothetical protein
MYNNIKQLRKMIQSKFEACTYIPKFLLRWSYRSTCINESVVITKSDDKSMN